MLIAAPVQRSPVGGRALLSRLIHDALTDLFGPRLMLREVRSIPLHGLKSFISALRGHVDGLDSGTIANIVATIRHDDVGKVLVDGSNFGKLAAAIKDNCPGIEVSTFFHNCEARFFLGALRQQPSIRACGVLIANYLAERSAVRFSDKRICLNERDSQLLFGLYGRKATDLAPMALHDLLPPQGLESRPIPSERYALFVGGNFYANRQGIQWYVDNVVKRSPIVTYVVGQGFDDSREMLERNGNVKVIGAVDDVAPWYMDAQVVVAPIFDGSGMKTKVAEALMFGKRVIGTPEALVGYDALGGDFGAVCTTTSEFLRALEHEARRAPAGFDSRLRGLYEDHYSYQAARRRLAAIFDDGAASTTTRSS